MLRQLVRLLGLLVICMLSLQLYFVGRVALMRWVDPASTSFERSEAWRLLREQGRIEWAQEWVDGERISPHLKRAVIASEDAGFTRHGGVEWDAVEKAWDKNQRVQARVERLNEQAERRAVSRGREPPPAAVPKIIGGSTITQQLAKNLFLDGERTLVRKSQELAITLTLEALLDKRRILEIYLNHVEWGEGVFGAQAAARHYFRTDAAKLGLGPSARLAVMLPAPKRFEQRPASPYVVSRAATIAARAGAVQLP
ncbi:monofunctional biosynthetic peptidoglycan transglycosylase [Azohydromonas sp. G-1-1-14]|uniref:Biosynthetic peptidoglycan transglycosylase n=1 Tax=Azohydromonas caseinilytica TaxID=2728836 RepID=A0A848F8Y5_9BURK|nr:monofunctional biosynthetic peptidoglycan transglycosylase [Azohydromonas caseinilytica]